MYWSIVEGLKFGLALLSLSKRRPLSSGWGLVKTSLEGIKLLSVLSAVDMAFRVDWAKLECNKIWAV